MLFECNYAIVVSFKIATIIRILVKKNTKREESSMQMLLYCFLGFMKIISINNFHCAESNFFCLDSTRKYIKPHYNRIHCNLIKESQLLFVMMKQFTSVKDWLNTRHYVTHGHAHGHHGVIIHSKQCCPAEYLTKWFHQVEDELTEDRKKILHEQIAHSAHRITTCCFCKTDHE